MSKPKKKAKRAKKVKVRRGPKMMKVKSCPSGKAYAGGKKKGTCVPSKPGKWCWAKSRDSAIEQLQLYNKRVASAIHAGAVKKQKKADAIAAEKAAELRAEEGAAWTASEYDPELSGFGRRRRRRRSRRR